MMCDINALWVFYLIVTTFLTYIYNGHDRYIYAKEKSIWILEWVKL